MSRLGRLLFGCTVLGVTAATVYYYLEEKEMKRQKSLPNPTRKRRLQE